MGDIEQSIKEYSKAIELEPDYAICYSRRAEAYGKLGKTSLAESDKKKIQEIYKKKYGI